VSAQDSFFCCKPHQPFRSEVANFIESELPDSLKKGSTIRSAFEEDGGADRTEPSLKNARAWWREALRAKGWLAPAWPVKYGGGGLSPAHQFVLIDEFIKHDAPRFFDMGLGMIGPTIISHGKEEQKQHMLPPILSGEHEWCELFSEPAAGSDLAGLQCRAVKDGDEYVVNGQKIWTTLANRANWGLLMARTNPEAPRHLGISILRVNMRAPGVTVRRIQNLTNHEFNEVFFEDVRVPANDAKTTAECEAILTEGNVPCSGYSTLREALKQPHLEHRGSYEVINDGAGLLKVPNPPFKLRTASARARSRVPSLGADNAEVLGSVLGYSSERIAALEAHKIPFRK